MGYTYRNQLRKVCYFLFLWGRDLFADVYHGYNLITYFNIAHICCVLVTDDLNNLGIVPTKIKSTH